jgi:hypothetical protein
MPQKNLGDLAARLRKFIPAKDRVQKPLDKPAPTSDTVSLRKPQVTPTTPRKEPVAPLMPTESSGDVLGPPSSQNTGSTHFGSFFSDRAREGSDGLSPKVQDLMRRNKTSKGIYSVTPVKTAGHSFAIVGHHSPDGSILRHAAFDWDDLKPHATPDNQWLTKVVGKRVKLSRPRRYALGGEVPVPKAYRVVSTNHRTGYRAVKESEHPTLGEAVDARDAFASGKAKSRNATHRRTTDDTQFSVYAVYPDKSMKLLDHIL